MPPLFLGVGVVNEELRRDLSDIRNLGTKIMTFGLPSLSESPPSSPEPLSYASMSRNPNGSALKGIRILLQFEITSHTAILLLLVRPLSGAVHRDLFVFYNWLKRVSY